MTRLLLRAGLVAGLTAVALSRLPNDQGLLAWELVIVAVLLWQIRDVPSQPSVSDPPLFDFSRDEGVRLPRNVSGAEMTVLEALSGRPTADRRLRPTLRRIAEHRLQNLGIDFESPAAADALGESEWFWLAKPADVTPDAELLDRIVGRLEAL